MLDIKLCLLDFDGTLFDTIESLYPVFINSFKDAGITITKEDCLPLTRVRLTEGYLMHAPNLDNIETYFKGIDKYLNSRETVEATKIYDDTIDFLNKAKEKGYKLGIVTSNNTLHVKEVLKFFNIDENIFSVYVGNKETKNHKPNPDPILYALEHAGENYSKENVIYVGDAQADVECAKSAGVIPVLLDRNNEYNINDIKIIRSLNEIFKI